MHTIKEYSQIVNEAITQIQLPTATAGLYDPIKYVMSLGGKRLRPVMVLMTCEALGGECMQAMNSAIGLEFFHNFTLLHDDVMDKADMRRGKPTVHKVWDENTAILSGDAMLTIATHIITANHEPQIVCEILQLFNSTALEIFEGQQYDMDYENRTDVSVAEYINMIKLKTSVLFGCACKLGAISANASIIEQNRLYNFGLNLGLAFQLQDDYLDVYGNPETFGKNIGGDIINGKRTFMLITAYSEADEATKKELDTLFAITDPARYQEKIDGVRSIYNRLSIPEICDKAIGHYCDVAIEALNSTQLQEEGQKAFEEFVKLLMNRQK